MSAEREFIGDSLGEYGGPPVLSLARGVTAVLIRIYHTRCRPEMRLPPSRRRAYAWVFHTRRGMNRDSSAGTMPLVGVWCVAGDHRDRTM